jgi:hypothetical protein
MAVAELLDGTRDERIAVSSPDAWAAPGTGHVTAALRPGHAWILGPVPDTRLLANVRFLDGYCRRVLTVHYRR